MRSDHKDPGHARTGPTSSAWVLVVEDNEYVSRAFARALRSRVAVRVAATVEAARELVAAEGLIGAIIDVRLPDGDGFEVVEALRRARPEVPLTICSGQRDMAVVDRATEHEVGYFSKTHAAKALVRFVDGLPGTTRSTGTYATPLGLRVDSFADRHKLSVQQHAVLRLAARRLSHDGIARELGVTTHTVEFHARRIRAKTGMRLTDCVREILAEDALDSDET